MPQKPNYVLKPGAILTVFGDSRYYANPLKDEIAEKYLSDSPGLIRLFSEYPDDWKVRCGLEEPSPDEEASLHQINEQMGAAIEKLKTQLTEALEQNALLQEEKEELAKQVVLLQHQIEGYSEAKADADASQIDSLQSRLEEANASIVSLKNENRSLKAANTKLREAAKQ